jgi:hypothetical protein
MSIPEKSCSEKNIERDPDFINAEIALKHAALKARQRALQAGVGVIVLQGGQIMEERPDQGD